MAPVRISKFRHVHGSSAPKERCYENTGNAPAASPDSNGIDGNNNYFAIPWQGGGGPFTIIPLSATGRAAALPNLFQGHSGPVQDLGFSPFAPSVIASASEDTTVRVWNFGGALDEGGALARDVGAESSVVLEGHHKKTTLLRWHPAAENVLLSVSFDLTVKVWDALAGREVSSVKDIPDVVQHAAWSYNGSTVAFTCKDKSVRICDPRKGSVVTTFSAHQGSKGARVCFLGSHSESNGGHLLATTGFSRQSDRQLFIWDARNTADPLSKTDVDQASGSLMPFYDPDAALLYLAGKGDCNIRYYEIVSGEPHQYYIDSFTGREPQRGAVLLPKRVVDTHLTEIGRFLRVCPAHVEPVSFSVPRKSDNNADLYPPTAADTPALDAAAWLGGADKAPVLAPLSEAMAAAAAAAAPPSPAAALRSPKRSVSPPLEPFPPRADSPAPPGGSPAPTPPPKGKGRKSEWPQGAGAPAETAAADAGQLGSPVLPSAGAGGAARTVALRVSGESGSKVAVDGTITIAIPSDDERVAALEARVQALEAENAALRAQLPTPA